MGTILVLLVICATVVWIIRNMINDYKNGKSVSCGCSCSQCHGGCHANLKKEIDRLRNAGE